MNKAVDSLEVEPGRPSRSEANESDLLWLYLKSVPAFRALLRAVESRFYQHIELPEPVLDLGCGDGLFAELTFENRLSAGVDPWWGPLRKAIKSSAYDSVVQGYGHNLPYPDGHFASAISNSVLEHIPDLQPVLYEIHRVLQDDGQFVVTMPSQYFTNDLGGAMFLEKLHLKSLADGYRRIFNRIARHAHADAPEKWADRFADAGFSVSRWQYYFSTEALHALELGHFQGIPSAIIHALTGHWILAPWKSSLGITERWVRPFYEEEPPETGTMVLFILRKSRSRPIAPLLPDPSPIDLSVRTQELEALTTASADPIVAAASQADSVESRQGPPAFIDEVSETESPSKDTRLWSLPKGVQGISLLLISLIAAIFGMNSLGSFPGDLPQSIPWFLGSALALVLAGNPVLLSETRTGLSQGIRNAPRRRWLVLVSLVMALIAYLSVNSSSANPKPFLALISWIMAIFLAIVALRVARKSSEIRPFRQSRRSWELPVMVGVLILALGIRLLDLTSHPFILSGSEASIGLDAWAVADGRIQNPFATAWLTNPTLPLYLLSVPISIFGRSIMAIRILSPFIGTLTVVAVYLFGRRLWGPVVGLFAAILLAGSHIHVHYSRLGMTNIWDPLFASAALGLIYVAWQERNRSLWILAGIVTGLNAYLFTTSHILPIILFGIFIYLLRDWREIWEQRSAIFAAFILALIVSLPQLLFYRSNPNIFFDRANTLGIIQSGWYLDESAASGLSLSEVVLRQLWYGLNSFNAGLDNSTSYNPGTSILSFWVSALFLVGVGLAVWRFKQLRNAILLVWVLVTLIFAGALLERPPNSHRLLIALPAVYLITSLGVIWLTYRLLRFLKLSKRYVVPVVLSVVIIIAVRDMMFYFGDYQNQGLYGDRNTEVANEVAVYLDSLEGQWLVYFYGAPSMYTSFPTFSYLVSDLGIGIQMVDVEEPGSIPATVPGTNVLYVFLPERIYDLEQVQEHYGDGELTILPGFHANPLTYIYQVQG